MTTTQGRRSPSGQSGESDVAVRPWQPNLAASALVGVIAVALAIGLAELVAALGQWINLLTTASSPINSLGSAFISLTPEWLKEWAIRNFGQQDKTALKVGMGITLVLVAAVVGIIARRRPRLAVAATVLLVLVTLVAVYTRTGALPTDGLPIMIGAAAGIYLLVTAFRRMLVAEPVVPGRAVPGAAGAATPMGATTPEPEAAASSSADTAAFARGVDRRQFFRVAGIGAAVAAAAAVLTRWIPSTAEVQASRAKVAVPVPLAQQKIPAGTSLNVNGITPFVTPNAEFYKIDTTLTAPRLRAEDWQLTVHGMVDNAVTLDYAQLRARPQIERAVTLTCVSNEVGGDLAGNATWIGARIDDLLKEAGPQAGADCVLCTSIDGFTSSSPLDALTDGRDAMLAVAMNGEPLPIDHGFPVRMVVPGLYGYVSATKWVVDLEVTQFSKVTAYWTSRGWSDHGPVKTASRIDVPSDSSRFDIGHAVVFGGMAWAQHRGIKSVEVQVDNGPWQPAQLSEALSADTWRQWKLSWPATAGSHTAKVRAIDGTGAVQVSAEAPPAPDGATGYHSISFTVN